MSPLPQGFFSATDLQASAFARVLLVAPAKVGKTTSIAATAPGPVLILNCDGRDAPLGAVNQMTEEQARQTIIFDVYSLQDWARARAGAIKLANEGIVRHVLVDTASRLSEMAVSELKVTRDGYKLWDAVKEEVYGGVDELSEKLEAHLYVIAHIDAMSGDDAAAGILPMIAGSSKRWIPTAVNDWVYLDAKTDGTRQFLLGPQKFWPFSGRNVKKSLAVDATVPALFEALGIKP